MVVATPVPLGPRNCVQSWATADEDAKSVKSKAAITVFSFDIFYLCTLRWNIGKLGALLLTDVWKVKFITGVFVGASKVK